MFSAYERPVPWGWASLDVPLNIVARIMSFVMALHAHYLLSTVSQNKGSGLTPYTNVSSWWLIQIIFIEVKSLCSPRIRSLDLWIQGSFPYQSRHGGCKDWPAKAQGGFIPLCFSLCFPCVFPKSLLFYMEPIVPLVIES